MDRNLPPKLTMFSANIASAIGLLKEAETAKDPDESQRKVELCRRLFELELDHAISAAERSAAIEQDRRDKESRHDFLRNL